MRKFNILITLFGVFLAGLLTLLANAGPLHSGDIIIEDPWARASIGTGRPSAAYMTIRNEGKISRFLVGVNSPAAEKSRFHQTVIENGISAMTPINQLEIPAGASIILKPGGVHIMLMGLRRPLKKGEKLPISLIFKTGGPINISIPIGDVGSMISHP